MSITRGEFLRSLGKSLPGLVASTGVATAAGALVRRLAEVMPEDETAPPPPGLIPFFARAENAGPRVALTFDDGPQPGVTERLLEGLRARGVAATFFMIGEKIAAAPDLARRVRDAGHEIGLHGYTHRKLTELSDRDVENELDRVGKIVRDELGAKAGWLRPPFGALRQNQARLAQTRGLRIALWEADSEDWREPGEITLVKNIGARTKAGSIILCHELSSTADGIDCLLDELARRQFRPVTISALFSAETTAAE